MATTPTISIVLPTYNGARYLEQSLKSCLEQTHKDFELICVDDCSTDETPKILARYAEKDPRVRVVRNPTNLRLPTSLNVGFAQARGKYWTWTSDDNLYLPEALARMLKVLEERPEIGIVYTDCDLIDADGKVTGQYPIQAPNRLWEGGCIGACFLYRREVQEKLGGYAQDLFCAEDYDFWLKASTITRLLPLYQPLYLYRDHPESLTRSKKAEAKLSAYLALSRNLNRMKWLHPREQVEGHLRLVKESLELRRFKEAPKHLLRAFWVRPLKMPIQLVKKISRGLSREPRLTIKA
jgi:glycosyltransferase involved in cell wall biosynthesis